MALDIFKKLSGSQYQDEKTMMLQLRDFIAFPFVSITLDKTKQGDNTGQADIKGFTHIGTFLVPAGREYMVGLRPHRKGGIFYVEFRDNTDTIIQGQALLKLRNPARTKIIEIAMCNTREFDPTDYLNRLSQPLLSAGLNVDTVWVTEDSSIELWFKPEVDGSVIDGTKTNIFLVDTTVRYV